MLAGAALAAAAASAGAAAPLDVLPLTAAGQAPAPGAPGIPAQAPAPPVSPAPPAPGVAPQAPAPPAPSALSAPPAGMTLRRVGPPPELPADAMPMDVDPSGARVLLSSYSAGLVELSRGPSDSSGWSASRRWRPGSELPAGIYGDAQYAGGGREVAVVILGQGVAVVRDGRVTRLEEAKGWPRQAPLRLLAASGGGFWVAFEPQPFGNDSGGGVALVRSGAVERMVPLPDRALATIGRWVELPGRRGVLAATRAGALEIRRDGTVQIRSRHPASSLARRPGGRTIALAGSAVERSEGDRFVPVLFRLDSPDPGFKGPPGDPIDVAIGSNGCWYVLYARGVLGVLDPSKGARATLTPSHGVPASARRLLAVPGRGEILIGSAEGLSSLADPETCASTPE